jgi:hypothetical protein
MQEIENQVFQIQPLNRLDITWSPLKRKKKLVLLEYVATKPHKVLNFSHHEKLYVRSCL